MSGENILRFFVYGATLAFLAWALLLAWVVTKSLSKTAWRLFRRHRPLDTARSVLAKGKTCVPEVTDGRHASQVGQG